MNTESPQTTRYPTAEPVTSRSVLTPAGGFLSGFSHTLNPYMGCAWGSGGCGVYCYVAESPIGVHGPAPWGAWLKAKVNAAAALRADLQRLAGRGPVRVFMSSATDPYQPAEGRWRISRSLLEVFRDHPIALLVVQTRSPLVERDFDLLAQLPFAWLSMTVETDDDRVRRALTPACPGIPRRLATMRRAREAGIRVQAAVSPALPGDAARFAGLLAQAADRVVVDSFAGDGAGGRRTARRPLPAQFAAAGHGDWRDQQGPRGLLAALRERLGPDRVVWSQEGFNSLAAGPGTGTTDPTTDPYPTTSARRLI